ncbi:BglG family transcription antiterminator [Enterococcus dongliensis]|uniref:Helix-turn-helix domain-containing protein n=1 Tax=Enterococcus dongliensis TaxID=2559925 RepID=A0ABU3ENH0_9ENTE|nr:helix-turn-helix domain-containing protein [Enterococcus dongliensis]MDT2596398.1 helix-turn-helix domain-containing protein [Enterococcus dongliensis]MDT2603756.1 helix-turn-helix domain-containing protein [Enterococcus dongliensis]MDT2644974.1 helix-turn-helix domain-containing protein [Enterococcus dongliensis]MDT2647388.1 helix-turn-helix domain-containing protein [Enterococcus dongliensis]MDT2667919.1 helix-turn-helix domain-containing protein [Enterococcus dongliensis]
MALINRWYKLLQNFITYDRLNLEELQKITDTSAQTTKKAIQLLNDQMENIAIIEEKENLYSLKVKDSHQFSKIMNGSLKQQTDFNSSTKRMAVLIDCFIKDKDYVVIDDLSEVLGVSRSTVNKDLRNLKKIMSKYQISLIGTPNKGLKISGTESQLRLLYLYHAYDYLEQPTLSTELLQQVDAIALNKKMDFRTLGLLQKNIILTIQRIKAGKPLTQSVPHYINYFSEDQLLEELFVSLATNYGLTISKFDFDFLCFPLNIFNNNLVPEYKGNNAEVNTLFHYMMNQINSAVIINLDQEILFQNIRSHFMFLINRIIFQVETYDIFRNEFKQKHAFAHELAEIGITALARFLQKPIQQAELSYLAIYFELALKSDTQSNMKEIAVVCNTGKGTALMIKRQLETVLGPNIRIAHYSEEEYETKDLDRYFAVFTTIPLKHTKATTAVIKLTDLFNENWLLSEWKRIIASKAASFDHIQFSFEQLDEQLSYEENLDNLLTRLQSEQLIDSSFKEYILTKAQEESAVIDNGIAFPHGINQQSEEILVTIGNYPTGRSLEDIELIFLVAIPENLSLTMEEELLSFYDTIFIISSNKVLREQVKQINSKEEYRQLLVKG